MITAREVQTVTTFVVPPRRERYVGFVSTAKLRPKFLQQLYHFEDFDPACVIALSGPSDSASGVVAELKRLGAGDDCYVISNARELDGQTMSLAETIQQVFAVAPGTVVCCVPGRLAYFEGEGRNNRFILHRRTG
jgi:hypothetical protein